MKKKNDLQNRVCVVGMNNKNAEWRVVTTKPRKGFIHTLLLPSSKVVLVKEVTLYDGASVTIFPGEVLGFKDDFGNDVPVVRV